MAASEKRMHRALLRELFDAAITATNGTSLLSRGASVENSIWRYRDGALDFQFPLPAAAAGGKLVVLGAGKAAAAMAAGLEVALGSRIDAGCIVVKYGHALPLSHIRVIEAGHPVPDAAGAAATQEILNLAASLSSRDAAFVVISGGASALLTAPASGLTLQDKSQVNQLLVQSGASISEINTVRKHLSAVKGGRLLQRANGARLCTLVISDVMGDDLSTIGSGPTVIDPTTFQEALAVLSAYRLEQEVPERALARLRAGARGGVPETLKPTDNVAATNAPLVIANLDRALAGMAARARTLEITAHVQQEPMRGDTHAAARDFADRIRSYARTRANGAPPLALLAGGETTLCVRGSGRGGRSQEFALVVATALAGVARFCVLAAGTDGTDGPTDVAGAFADGTTLERAVAAGLDPQAVLLDNNSYRLFDATNDHFRTGPTGTNVTDVCIAIVW